MKCDSRLFCELAESRFGSSSFFASRQKCASGIYSPHYIIDLGYLCSSEGEPSYNSTLTHLAPKSKYTAFLRFQYHRDFIHVLRNQPEATNQETGLEPRFNTRCTAQRLLLSGQLFHMFLIPVSVLTSAEHLQATLQPFARPKMPICQI